MSIFYRFRYIASYLSKVADFAPPTCIRRARRGWPRPNFAEIFGVRKLQSCGVVCVTMYLAVLLELRLVSHRQTQASHGNKQHVLQSTLSGTMDTKYHLRPRPHNFKLTAKNSSITECDFITRMLFKDVCCHYVLFIAVSCITFLFYMYHLLLTVISSRLASCNLVAVCQLLLMSYLIWLIDLERKCADTTSTVLVTKAGRFQC